MDADTIFIDINNSFIDINKWENRMLPVIG